MVITNLHSHGMPFIRYAQGDRAILAPESCTCGCRLPLLKQVCGRITDSLVRPDGRRMPALALLTLISTTPGLRRYRLIQDRDLSLRLEAVADQPLPAPVTVTLTDALSDLMGGPIPLQIDYSDHAAYDTRSKFHRIISHADL